MTRVIKSCLDVLNQVKMVFKNPAQIRKLLERTEKNLKQLIQARDELEESLVEALNEEMITK